MIIQDKKKTVIVVNCSPERAENVRKLLAERKDLKVIAHVFDGQTGLDLARLVRPDLVYTCVSLPRLSGIELARAINRESEQTRVLIGTVQYHLETEAYDAGADAYLVYPCTPEEILRAVDAALAGARGRSPAQPPDPFLARDQGGPASMGLPISEHSEEMLNRILDANAAALRSYERLHNANRALLRVKLDERAEHDVSTLATPLADAYAALADGLFAARERLSWLSDFELTPLVASIDLSTGSGEELHELRAASKHILRTVFSLHELVGSCYSLSDQVRTSNAIIAIAQALALEKEREEKGRASSPNPV